MIAAVVLMLAAGGVYRAVAQAYSRLDRNDPLPPGTLAKLPMQLGVWQGIDVPLDPEIVKKTRTDQHVNRLYRHGGKLPPVFAFVAYGVSMRDLLPHRPEVCYPGAGWTWKSTTKLEIPDAWDGRALQCQVHRFERGMFGAEQVTVLNYYIVDGETCPDVELLRGRSARPQTGVHYSAQVQISCAGGSVGDATRMLSAVTDFAATSALPLQALLPTAFPSSAPASRFESAPEAPQ